MSQFPGQFAQLPKKPGFLQRLKRVLMAASPLHNANRIVALITSLVVVGIIGLTGYFGTRIIALIPAPSTASEQVEISSLPETKTQETEKSNATTSTNNPGSPSNPSSTPQTDQSTSYSEPSQGVDPTEGPTENPVNTPVAKPVMKTDGALLSWSFTNTATGTFTAEKAYSEFNNANGVVTTYSVAAADSLYVEKQGSDAYLVKKMPKGSYNARSGSPLRHSMAIDWKLNKPLTSGYFAYNFKTSANFDGVKGGKMPGLCGGTCPSGGDQTTNAPRLPDGGNNPAGKAIGWSGRNMWQSDGHLIQYFYHPNQTSKYAPGYSYRYASGGRTYINDNKWHSIEHYVKVNTPGKSDGVFQAWFDGTRVLNLQNIRFRDDTSYAIDTLMFSVFFGGGDASFATTKDEYLYFDDFVLSRKPITH